VGEGLQARFGLALRFAPPCVGCAIGFNFGSAKKSKAARPVFKPQRLGPQNYPEDRGFVGFEADMRSEARVRKFALVGDEALALFGAC
jgi:hypothetical protein